MRNGIGGTVVANLDSAAQDSGTTTFTDSATRVWTLNGSATFVNASARFHGEMSALAPVWDKTASDHTVPVTAYGILRRLEQGQAPLKSVMHRVFTTAEDVVAYWPCEDPAGATEFASGLPDGPSMVPAGETTNATYELFRASDPLPEASGVLWNGKVPTYTHSGEIQVGFLMHVPAGGVASISQVCRFRSLGTAFTWTLHVNTAGDLRLQAFDNGGGLGGTEVQLLDTGYLAAHAVNGKKARITISLKQDGSDIEWDLCTDHVGSSSLVTSQGTLLGETIGRVSWVNMNVGGILTTTALGHISVRSSAPFVNDVTSDQLDAYQGETATARILRLCQEEDVPVTIEGDVTDAVLMGPQLSNKLVDLLRECAESDMGVLYEPRGFLGLAYRTRASLYCQAADLTLDYAAGALSSIEPVEDDDATRNDITVSRVLGSSVRKELTEGPLSIEAVGRYDDEVEISLSRDLELWDQVGWRLHLGTIDEARYPVLGFDLAMSAFLTNAALTAQALALDVGDRVVVTNLPDWLSPDDVQQITQGYTEHFDGFNWLMDINCSPGSPWDVAIWDDSSGPGEARYSTDLTTLAEDLTTTETGVDVSTPAGPVWGTADLPYDIAIGGERMTVTAVTGTGAAQTFTVTRSVNGVVKTHLTGAEVRLFKPARYAL
jgi:hypothetical protein